MEEKLQSPRKIALFGGSFDPVTKAHLKMIEKLCKRFDKVVVLPCAVSPFKQTVKACDGTARVKMLEKCTDGYDRVKVSKYELKQGGTSYSYKTVEHFAEKYEGDELYFVVGSDGLDRLTDWKNIDRMAKLCTFYLVPRPGFPIAKKLLEQYAELGIRIERAKFKGDEGSSCMARVAVAFDRIVDFVPAEAADYIKKHNLYDDYKKYTDKFGLFGMKDERVEHTFRTAELATLLCKKFDGNEKKVIPAVILHDIGKYADKKKLESNGVKVDKSIFDLPEPIRHAPIGAEIARQYFGIDDDEIINAITRHTTGVPDMTVTDKIVYLADAGESGRTYPEAEKIARAAKRNLDRAMKLALKTTVDSVSKAGDVYPDTLAAYDFYRKRRTLKPSNTIDDAKPKKTGKSASKNVVYGNAVSDSLKANSLEITQNVEETSVLRPKITAPIKVDDVETPEKLAYGIAAYLSEKRGRNIVIIDLGEKTIVADYFVICGAKSTTAVKALCEHLDERLSKNHGIEPLRRDIDGKWAAIDYGSVIVHVFHEEAREFYQLERLWNNGTNLIEYKD